jgi:hypothetical protein
MKPGDSVRVDFPGHALHGRTVEIIDVLPDFDLAVADDAEPLLTTLVMVRHTGLPQPIGIGLSHIGGTVENASRRKDEGADQRQAELLL